MGVLHAFQCKAHGTFEKRVEVKKGLKLPKCPHGCSKSMVSVIYVQAPGHIKASSKRADRLVRQAADMQGLSDISLSPSRSGGSVMDRNRKKYPLTAAARAAKFGEYMGALTNKQNALTDTGFGHAYDKAEWKRDDKTGIVRHMAPQGPKHPVPMGATGVEIERVKEKL